MRDEKSSPFAVAVTLFLFLAFMSLAGIGSVYAYRRYENYKLLSRLRNAMLNSRPFTPPYGPTLPTTAPLISVPAMSDEERLSLYATEDEQFRNEVATATANIQFILDMPSLTTEEIDALTAATKSLETITELYRERVEERNAEKDLD